MGYRIAVERSDPAFSWGHLSLRMRLTAWYLLTLTLILFLSGLTLYWQ
ncbi:MAG: hypothetical protein R2854_10570 [Caldilineaceae bacterium]